MGMVGREKEQMPENLLVIDEAVKEFAPAVDGRLLPRTTVLGGLWCGGRLRRDLRRRVGDSGAKRVASWRRRLVICVRGKFLPAKGA